MCPALDSCQGRLGPYSRAFRVEREHRGAFQALRTRIHVTGLHGASNDMVGGSLPAGSAASGWRLMTSLDWAGSRGRPTQAGMGTCISHPPAVGRSSRQAKGLTCQIIFHHQRLTRHSESPGPGIGSGRINFLLAISRCTFVTLAGGVKARNQGCRSAWRTEFIRIGQRWFPT